MISVTQPRRPADDFLASLQTNLQGNARSRRRRVQQQPNAKTAAPNNITQKNNVAPKAQSRAKPAQQRTKQSRIKPSELAVNNRSSATKKSTNKTQAVQPSSSELQTSDNSSQPPELTNPSHPASNVQIEVIPSAMPEVVQQPAQPVEIVQNVAVSGYPLPPPTENPLAQQQFQNVRASQNNFYMKNQSNIFNTGFRPYQAHQPHAANRTSIAENTVVENALRIASQQPLPAPPSFSTPRGYLQQNQNFNAGLPLNQGVAPPDSGHGIIGQPQASVIAQERPYFGQSQPTQHVDQNPVMPHETKPINSHYSQSFSISGGAPPDTKTTQELERRKWIQELEAQVREKKERDQREKMRQKSPYPAPLPTGHRTTVTHPSPYNTAVSSHLQQSNFPPNIAPPPAPLQNYPPQQPPNNPPQQNTISSNTLQPAQPFALSMPSNQLQPPQLLHLAPKSPIPQSNGSPTQGRMLGQGTWVDPVELERRQEARKRALENQEMIKRQVEERERIKKEERERIKREEELEMKRIEEEKRKMAEEVRLEQEKKKQKEEAQLQQIAEMRRKIEEANRSAEEEKRSKRSRSASGKDSSLKHAVETAPLEPVEEIKARSSPVIETITTVKETLSAQTPVNTAPVPKQETVFAPAQQQLPTPVHEHAPVQQPVRYVSNAATQTVHEVSCQTMTREDSFLPADSKLIQLKERELSVVQRKQDSAMKGTTNRHDINKQGSAKRNIPNRNNNNNNSRRGPIKPQTGSKLPVKKQQEKKVPEVPRVQYDKNGRRIRPKVTKPPSPPPKEDTPPASNIIAEESEVITEYETIADIFDNPESPVMKVESVGPSPFTVPDQQVQMRYTSPKNEKRSIPSAISVRQNDILSQLEKLRMGLRDRRRNMSSTEIMQ